MGRWSRPGLQKEPRIQDRKSQAGSKKGGVFRDPWWEALDCKAGGDHQNHQETGSPRSVPVVTEHSQWTQTGSDSEG